jgi:hypothetical protein
MWHGHRLQGPCQQFSALKALNDHGKETVDNDKIVNHPMSQAEYQEAERLNGEPTCHSLSEYARRAVPSKPVVRRYRDQSLDDFIAACCEC